jgi:hypothetical protein
MSVHQRGTPVNLVVRFATVDPITEEATAANPTGVVFTIEDPDGAETAYTFGVDNEVTNPQLGTYVCLLAPPDEAGDYRYRAVGSGAVVAAIEGNFTVLDSGVLSPTMDEPSTGPCVPWITGSDVAAADASLGVGSNDFLLDTAAQMASDLMFSLSGRRFPGICQRTVRPCRSACGCWGSVASGLGMWAWQGAWWGYGSNVGAWANECGDRCGCGSLDSIRLAGYPVREILAVKISGQLVDASTYRLDGRRDLVRLADPGPPVTSRSWPACQNLALPDTEAGTFSVTYRHGMEPPQLGQQAAIQMAGELYKVLNRDDGCSLPQNVTKVVRQGVTIDTVVSVAGLLRSGNTGLQLVDAFIADVNPNRLTRRPLVWSPDQRQMPRRVG